MLEITGNVCEKEAMAYVAYLEKKYGRKVWKLNIDIDGDYVGLTYKFYPVPFERIRRITGYLVGDMSHWNDAKSKEEADRVKHNILGYGTFSNGEELEQLIAE